MRSPVLLGLMFGTIEIVANGFELLQGNVDRAALTSGQKERTLAGFQIALNTGPSSGSDAQSGSRNVPGDFVILQRMEVFQLLQAKSENIVEERTGGAAEKAFELGFGAGGIAIIDRDGAPNVPAGLALDPDSPALNFEIQPATMGAPIQRFVAAGGAAFVEAEQNGAYESHERAFTRLIGSMKNIHSRGKRVPCGVVPDAEPIDVDALYFHREL